MHPINKLILGTVQFGLNYGINNKSGKPSFDLVCSILDKAFNAGITKLDTAEAYGDAIEIIGRYHKQQRKRFSIISKFHGESKDFFLESHILSALETLGETNFDAYLFHSYSNFMEQRFLLRDLLLQKDKGRIRKVGVSIYTNQEFEAVLQEKEIELVQLPFNLLDNENKRGKLLESAKEKGKEIHTRSVFLQGLFFKDPEVLPEKLSRLSPYLKEVKGIAQEANISIGALALQYSLNNPLIDGVLFGVDSPEQLEINIEQAQQPIDKEILKEVGKIIVRETELLNPVNWN